jgi:hypothetical protein
MSTRKLQEAIPKDAQKDPDQADDINLRRIAENMTAQEYEDAVKPKLEKPTVIKRETLYDAIAKDQSAVSLLRAAEAAYSAQINKYNVNFREGPMA